jgi:hypothetical protein
MASWINAALDDLQAKLEHQLREAAETKRTINTILKSAGREPLYTDIDSESSTTIRPDQFYGKQFATAAQEYLERRKQACQAEEILRGLEAGGFDFDVMGWKDDDRLRSLAISLAKNNLKFHKLKNGSFGLKAWYDEDFLKKAGRQQKEKADSKKAAEAEKAESEEK